MDHENMSLEDGVIAATDLRPVTAEHPETGWVLIDIETKRRKYFSAPKPVSGGERHGRYWIFIDRENKEFEGWFVLDLAQWGVTDEDGNVKW